MFQASFSHISFPFGRERKISSAEIEKSFGLELFIPLRYEQKAERHLKRPSFYNMSISQLVTILT